MKKNSRLIVAVISFLRVVACAGGVDSAQPVSDQGTANDTANTQKETQSIVESENTVSTEEVVKELLKEFSEGIFFNLLAREQACLVETAGAEIIREAEKDFLSGGSAQEQYKEYFKACNIPPPPDSGKQGGQPGNEGTNLPPGENNQPGQVSPCLLYTSDAADE